MSKKTIIAISIVTVMIMMAFGGMVTAQNSNMKYSPSSISSKGTNNPAVNVTISYVSQLMGYLNANPNYSRIELNNAHFFNASANKELISHGNIILNNLTYKYTFHLTEYNNTGNISSTEHLILCRHATSRESGHAENHIYSNRTALSVLYTYGGRSLNKNTDAAGSSIYVNNTTRVHYMVIPGPHVIVNRVELPVLPLPSPGVTYNIKSSKHFTAYETVVNSKNSTNTTFSFSSPKISANGNSSTTRINNNTDRYENMTGIINNKNNNTKFMINIVNGNGTLSTGTDPVNFTFDPQSEGRSINGGYEYMWMDTATLSYFEGVGLESIVSIIAGAASLAVPVTGVVAGPLSLITVVMAYYDATFITSYNTDILYVEAGWWHPYAWWLSWLYEPYMEIGYHTDEVHNMLFGGTTHITWTYIPLFASTGYLAPTEKISNVAVQNTHMSFFPTWNPSV